VKEANRFSEHPTRNKPNFTHGLVERSGHPEQWSKTPPKYDLFRIIGCFWDIWSKLEKFGLKFGELVSVYKRWYD